MTFQQLQYLLAIHEAGSISQAAKNLFVSQPSISVSLSTLEEELGFSIFTRNQRGLVPTPEGSRAIEYARCICSSHKNLTSIQAANQTVFRCSGASYRPFINAYTQLAEECAGNGTRFRSYTYSPGTTIQKLANFELEVGVLITLSTWVQEIQRQMEKHNLSHQVLGSFPIAIRLGTAHPLCSKEEITPHDLKGLTLLEMPAREISNSIYKGILPIDPENVITYTSGEMAKLLVSKGLGYSIGLPLSKADCQKYGIRNIPLHGYSYKFIVATNSIQPETAETARFIELLKKEIKRFNPAE